MWINNGTDRDKIIWRTQMIQELILDIKLKKHLRSKNIIIINPQDTTKTIQQIKQLTTTSVHIYDITYNQGYKANDIIKVSDHINKTGHNPLIGQQNKLKEPFIDISELYNSNKGITTHCLGEYFNKHKDEYKYPSKYLCHISIIAKAFGKDNIKAFLINLL